MNLINFIFWSFDHLSSQEHFYFPFIYFSEDFWLKTSTLSGWQRECGTGWPTGIETSPCGQALSATIRSISATNSMWSPCRAGLGLQKYLFSRRLKPVHMKMLKTSCTSLSSKPKPSTASVRFWWHEEVTSFPLINFDVYWSHLEQTHSLFSSSVLFMLERLNGFFRE